EEFGGGGLKPVRRYSFLQPWRADRPLDLDRLAVVRDVCQSFEVNLVHVHHLLGSGPEAIKTIKGLGIPLVFSFHDFYTVFPTIHLLDDRWTFCGGRCT